MLTLRSRWMVVAALLFIAIGLIGQHALTALLGLTLFLWIVGEGLLFLYRVRTVVRGLNLLREVRDDRGPVTSLWAGRLFEVRLTLTLDDEVSLPYLAFEEPVPFGMDVLTGEPRGEGAVSADEPLQAAYQVRVARPGAVRFEGVRVQLADLHGLFYHVAFVRLVEVYRVLPMLVDAEGKTAASKRYNLLPPPGIHRLSRPGSGSELLDLRDYMPGDPPKTIAWKVSARRDRLITKEYESEVPIRCTLFLDTSPSVRLGPPGKNALTRLVEIASGVAQANLSARDLTGLCLFDEEKTRILKPARTRRHLVDVFNQLAEASGVPASAGAASVDALLPLAYSFAEEVYPEQLAVGVNHLPGWLPYFVPAPGHWVTPLSLRGRLYRWIVYPLVTVPFLLVAGLFDELLYTVYHEPISRDVQLLVSDLISILRGELVNIDLERDREEMLPPYDYACLALIVFFCLLFPIWLGLWRDAPPLLFSPRRRRVFRMRKKMAALFAARYDLGPGGIELLLQDDRHLAVQLERFLNEHHIPHTPRLFDESGRFLYASPKKIDVLASALLRAVGKGHDNELFVLFVDLVELGPKLEPLLRAVKVALARHHQVMVVIPWPPDLDPPGREEERGARSAEREEKREPVSGGAKKTAMLAPWLDVKEQVKRLTSRRYVAAFHQARRAFARLQVPVVCASDAESTTLILARIDRLRGLRRRR